MNTMSSTISQQYIWQDGSYKSKQKNSNTYIDNPVQCKIAYVWEQYAHWNETSLYNESTYLTNPLFSDPLV